MATPITCSNNDLTPEDFFRKWVRTDGAGNYALARKDVTASGTWVAGTSCQDGLTWKDIVMLIANQDGSGNYAISTVDV